MRLVAVTICINYADYLECVIENRVHFDRWVVMTVAGDVATHALCAKYGIECYDSELLQADGKDFHAVDNKGPVLNEGLVRAAKVDGSWLMVDGRDASAVNQLSTIIHQPALSTEGGCAINQLSTINHQPTWCVVLDADVLLPRYFGERVRGMPLEAGVLYAMGGRKVCETREQFEMLRDCQPWDRLVARNSQALGYFNLFSLEVLPNRYPVRTGGEGGQHDDYLFTTSFAPELRRMLPFTAIHLGEYGRNWAGRVSPLWAAARAAGVDGLELMVDGRDASAGVEINQRSTINDQQCCAVIGYFPGGRWREVVEGFGAVYLVDHFCVHAESGSGMVEADRAALRGRFEEEIGGMAGLHRLGTHSVENVGKIADGSLDLLYIPGEVAPEWLCRALPYWLPKLRDGATICGEVYGLPHWPDATYTLAFLLGTPERVDGDGRWWKTCRAGECKLPLVVMGDGRRGVVFVNSGAGCLESLILSLFAARKHWAGWMVVMHYGAENESLRLLCARLGVEIFHVCMEARGDWDELLEEVARCAPCPVAMVLLPWHLAVGALASAFDGGGSDGGVASTGWQVFRSEPRIVDEAHSEEGTHRPPQGQPVGRRFTFAPAQTYAGTAEDGCVVVFSDAAEEWSEAAWAVRCEVEAEAALASAPRVRLAEETTVVALVLAEEAGDFQRNWLTWNFTPGTPVLVLLAGMSAEELWLPGAGENVRVLPCAGDLESVLGMLAETVQTRLVTFLPGTAAVLPGAELWRGGEAPVLHATEAGEKERETTGNDFIPATIFAQVEVATLREVAPTARGCALSEWPKFLHRTASIAGLRREDMGGLGWKFPAVYRLLGRSPMERTVVAVRESRKGLLELADEVVVVSLPERMDRRNRIVAMMAEEKVAFRFVDGVRVRDEDILPEEIAEVGRQGFKEVGTFEKYLRGMVGCRRAHLRVLEKAYADGLDSLLILEDDAHLETGWLKRYQAALGELPTGWLQLYLSAWDYGGSHFSKSLRRMSFAYQTTAILYSKAGIEAALNCLRHSRSEIDHWMGHHLHPFGNSYLIQPRIAYQEGGVSDIMSFDRGMTP